MRKTITYSTFIISTLLILLVFVTAKTYVQLGFAVLLYPILAYFALKIFPRKAWKTPVISIQIPTKPTETPKVKKSVEVTDIDKRVFLKLIGATGISLLLFSLLGRKTDGLFFGKNITLGPGNESDNKISPTQQQITDGYKISEVDDNDISYYGFTNNQGAWFIMRLDTENNSFRYTRGNSEFPQNWTNRENLKYDYFYNVFQN